MLTRVLEPEVMDSPEEATDYDAMDHAAVNLAFVADLLTVAAELVVPQAPAGVAAEVDFVEVLDLGTGTAQIPIELAGRVASARITAVDAAESMLAVAADNLLREGLDDRVTLDLIDAKQLPYPDGSFVVVMSNSIVHHIPEPRFVLSEAVRVVAAGGLLFFRDLMRPADVDTLLKFVETYAAGANAHQRQMFADSLHAALDLSEIRDLVEELGFARESVQATSDRHWTWIGRRD